MRKRILITFSMIVMILGTYAQEPSMTLTFTADSNNWHVPLNSVMIENLTQGTDTMLFAPDTVLVLDYITGIEEVSGFSSTGFSLSQNYPNPMEGETTIGLHLSETSHVMVKVSDVMGREVVNHDFQLLKGSHSFTFYPGKESLYFFTARSNEKSLSIKMVNSPSKSSIYGNCKLVYNEQKTAINEYKSWKSPNNFIFNKGDLLKFTASTALGERVITSSPENDQTYYFHYTGYTCPGTPTVTDIDGNIYNTVQIGTQCWMKENLKTTTYNNGDPIPNETDNTEWINLTSGAYAWCDNDILYKDKYGAIYNWYAVDDPNGICPTGWHVPSNDEWLELIDFVGGNSSPNGNKLKSCRNVNSPLGGSCNTSEHPRWNQSDLYYGTNETGFSGLPGGYRSHISGNFNHLGTFSFWWTSTEYENPNFDNAYYRYLKHNTGTIYLSFDAKQFGFSVRCVKD